MGALLLSAVLAVPVLSRLMEVAALPWTLTLAIPGLALASMLVIQALKAIRTALTKEKD